ncbi:MULTISPECIES: LEPR-XLL domain-containing protein [unclassified Fibrobacter]|uniref:LEPR-XLL domain-containing protein n=1 Tax=unclassified Fibrobacter TaxID=2634177 RepID=UPI000D6CAD77|nr:MULTISPECIES: LEPR-XLL domain-containing protein [unclassified Fibrobacter]PWJ58102.1 hypothetical protein BGX12_1492 [Fibrobacter sp. UWR4]PZW72365.1 hypothetical protein C8E88_100796 [Fibrobacter sp. UWR1]
MNNNSRKSSKNASSKSSKARKNSKKNFKIENLEPRLMMDAATSFEVEKIETYVDQFASVSETIGNDITSAIDNIVDFNASSLGLTEGVETFSSLLEDSVGDFQTKIVDDVRHILTESLEKAKTDIETINESVDDKIESFSLSDFVSKYVDDVLKDDAQKEYGYLKFETDGSKLIVSVDLQHNTALNDLGLDFGMTE